MTQSIVEYNRSSIDPRGSDILTIPIFLLVIRIAKGLSVLVKEIFFSLLPVKPSIFFLDAVFCSRVGTDLPGARGVWWNPQRVFNHQASTEVVHPRTVQPMWSKGLTGPGVPPPLINMKGRETKISHQKKQLWSFGQTLKTGFSYSFHGIILWASLPGSDCCL